jgi:hypothetical protein
MRRAFSAVLSAALIAALGAIAPGSASAQVTGASESNLQKAWDLDLSGTVGVSPGIGAATTGLDLSGAVTLVRTNQWDEFHHRCLGLTAMATTLWAGSTPDAGSPREQGIFVGPRLDAGDVHGAGFVRVFAGARHLSSDGPVTVSQTTLGIGAGVGLEVLGVLFDINWLMSPWEARSSNRLTVSVGYIRSFRLGPGRSGG